MHEIAKGKLKSLSLLVGTGKCNAHCHHCAGQIHRQFAPAKDGEVETSLIIETLNSCYDQGARYLTISSSGEPTLSPLAVTKILELVGYCQLCYSPINLYSNGIRIGEDKPFADTYLPFWKNLGLTHIYLTVHDIDEQTNARMYGIKKYPELKTVISRIREANLLARVNLLLNRKTIDTVLKFVSTVEHLKKLGANSVSAWPIRGEDDKVDLALSPPLAEMNKMKIWIAQNNRSGFKVKLSSGQDSAVNEAGQKLTLFPNGKLLDTWCNS